MFEGSALPDQDHFLLELSIRVMLGADFVVEIQQLLQLLAPGRHHKANDVHQQLGHGLSIEHDCDNLPHGVQLGFVIAFLQLQLQFLRGWLIGSIVHMDKAVCIIEKRSHGGWLLTRTG